MAGQSRERGKNTACGKSMLGQSSTGQCHCKHLTYLKARRTWTYFHTSLHTRGSNTSHQEVEMWEGTRGRWGVRRDVEVCDCGRENQKWTGCFQEREIMYRSDLGPQTNPWAIHRNHLYVVFVDFEKAFDSLYRGGAVENPSKLWFSTADCQHH